MSLLALSVPAILLYLVAAVLLAAPITGCKRVPTWLGLATAAMAIILHGSELFSAHGGHVDLHFYAAVSLVAFGVAALTVIVSLAKPVAGLGVIVFPLAAALLALDMWVAPSTAPAILDWQIQLHVAIALIGYSVLSIAAVLAVLLALQEHALRHHHFSLATRALPPLTQTEALLFHLIAVGFAFLTLTLVSGAMFVHSVRDQHLAHIIVLTIIAWLIFATLLWGRWRHGWRGRRAVNMTLIGMAMLALGFFGSKFVLELILGRVA